jgi:hypothetical protein
MHGVLGYRVVNAIRRHRAWVAAIWLVCQTFVLGAAPGGMLCGDARAMLSASEDDDACCRGLGPGQICPMHKHRGHGSKPGGHGDHGASHAGQHGASTPQNLPSQPASDHCNMRSTCDPLTLAIESLISTPGLLPRVATIADASTATSLVTDALSSVPARTIAPDLPPPRA